MTTKPLNPEISSTEAGDDQIRTTVFEYDSFTIKKSMHRNITILEAAGSFTPQLGKELERQAGQVRNNLGLDLSGVIGIQPTILSSLQYIHKKITSRSKCFLLCNPPDKLLDILKLSNLTGQFQITNGLRDFDAIPASSPAPPQEVPVVKPVAEQGIKGFEPVQKEITQLTQTLKRTEKLEKGLDSACKCVRKILPAQPPKVSGYEFAFFFSPCDKVGGDFFDFTFGDDNFLDIAIGDVSGHGLDSAIIMAMAKKVLRLRAKDFPSRNSKEILCQVNRDLYEDLGQRIFITVLFVRMNLRSGLVHFARAGHEPPIRFQPGAKEAPVFCNSTGIAIGMDSGPRFTPILEERSIQLLPGEGLLLYTDGIVESLNSRRDLFSRQRLAYTLEHLQEPVTAQSVIETIGAAVDQFSQGFPQEDDMTAIAILRK
ncbi:MAG: SpoIIE family protein phosphatase [Planctomycetes bacterium]|nr:SpoIIE family protein phosphatase [Planctomycetota bacterium]